jgi:hypothetical protein
MRKTYIYKSSIHGKGLFAARRLSKGELIGQFRGIPIRVRSTLVRHPHVLWTRDYPLLGTNNLRFVNESNRPNAYFLGVHLISLRVIYPHEEVTADYEG